MRLLCLLLASVLVLPAAPANASGPAVPATCASADASLQRGSLEKARSEYLDVLASEESSDCAAAGLRQVTIMAHEEEQLCEEGKVLAEHGESDEARQRYVAALDKNTASQCASQGLGGSSGSSKKSGEEKNGLAQAKDDVTNFTALIAAAAIAILVVIGTGLAGWTAWKRRRPSLAIEPFADGAIEPKIGSAVAGLVEKQLIEISRLGGRSADDYTLDFIAADIELLASNESLDKALGGLAEASQLKLAVAILALLERSLGNHLIAKGELAPKGSEGHGLLLALQSQRKGVEARGALWGTADSSAAKPAAVSPAAAVSALKELVGGAATPPVDEKDTDPTPYYELADQGAAWIQYEAARALNPDVERITTSAKSFSLLSEGLTEIRAGEIEKAADRFAEALEAERGNVAALVNLSLVLARRGDRYRDAILLLTRALTVLEDRYPKSAQGEER